MTNLDVSRRASTPTKLSLVGTGPVSPVNDTYSHGPTRRHALPRPTRHLTASQYLRLLAFIEDQGGIVALDDVSRAMPHVQKPISAVFDLCDAGILNVDWEACCGGGMRLARRPLASTAERRPARFRITDTDG